jgi:hypothetical protein
VRESEGLPNPDERPLAPAARVAVVTFGLAATGAGLLTGYYAVALVGEVLSDRPVQPWPAYALGAAILAFPLLLLALGFLSIACRERRRLKLAAIVAGAAVAGVLLAVWLVGMPMETCVPDPRPAPAGAIEATGCLDRPRSPPA